jgi:hypothetical protein
MSEYQYYEFQTIDRLLTETEQVEVVGFNLFFCTGPTRVGPRIGRGVLIASVFWTLTV